VRVGCESILKAVTEVGNLNSVNIPFLGRVTALTPLPVKRICLITGQVEKSKELL
jgi:hypothetical protein